jgi:ribonuclease VapC
LHEWAVSVVPFGDDHWKQAADAYTRFGRGRHKAALNFGDCLAYAVAKIADQPLLCVGGDFSKTDLVLA